LSNGDPALRQFIVKEWAYNICTNYEVLLTYLDHRENREGHAGVFKRYRELYDEAKLAKADAVNAAQYKAT